MKFCQHGQVLRQEVRLITCLCGNKKIEVIGQVKQVEFSQPTWVYSKHRV